MFATDEFSERLAIAVCRACEVQPQCLDDVRTTEPAGIRYGVVAGLTPDSGADR
jgi:hypothetical protein